VILSRGAEELGIDPSSVWCDAMALRDHIEAGRFREALDLYRGDLLEGFFGDQSAAFQDWLQRERELLRATAVKAARAVAGLHERDRNYTPAVAAARRAVELSDSDERVMRELLQLLDRLGDRAGAIQAYNEFARRLATEYDAHPAAETKVLIDQIRTRADPLDQRHAPALVAQERNVAPQSSPNPALQMQSAPPSGLVAAMAMSPSAPSMEMAEPSGRTTVDSTGAHTRPEAAGLRAVLGLVIVRRWWLLGGALIGATLAVLAVRALS
jgi:hypothetical protein